MLRKSINIFFKRQFNKFKIKFGKMLTAIYIYIFKKKTTINSKKYITKLSKILTSKEFV